MQKKIIIQAIQLIWLRSSFHPKKAHTYPSEQAAVEQEKIQNQMTTMSAKLNEIDNRKEPVYAFRATSVKNSWSSSSTSVNYKPGKRWFLQLCDWYSIGGLFSTYFRFFVLKYEIYSEFFV